MCKEKISETGIIAAQHTIVVLGGSGGRFDQEVATLHGMYKWSRNFHRIVLLGDESTSCILEGPGEHAIHLISGVEGKSCGLLPIGKAVESVITEGLKWNLNGERLEMGVRISSSNTVAEDTSVVKICTSHDLIWTCSYDGMTII